MANLPEDGLIVSCYLESMKGAEKDFISAVAHAKGVVALRVEGVANIEYARRIAPDKFIIGLIKEFNGFRNIITPDLLKMGRTIIHAGADMVAAEQVFQWCVDNGYWRDDGIDLPFAVMCDLHSSAFFVEKSDDETPFLDKYDAIVIRELSRTNSIILATTFTPKAFDQVAALRVQFPDVPINLEGGIETAEEIQEGYNAGATYVTIGKAINDPVTIIHNLLKGTQ